MLFEQGGIMDKKEIFGWLMDIALGWIVVLVLVLLSKLTYDFMSAPNVFLKKEGVLTQKQMDDMCVAWWFDSDLTAARKRVCGK